MRFLFRRPNLAQVVPDFTGRLAAVAAIGYGLFALIASFMIWHSNLILL